LRRRRWQRSGEEVERAKVAIDGFGKIGRTALKIALDTPELDPVAANDLAPAADLAYLLRYDTVSQRVRQAARMAESI
jgi:glyceraldehyde 3-phosphate dehydrogenase